MTEPLPASPRPAERDSGGIGTLIIGGVLVGGAFFGIQTWRARSVPPPEPAFSSGSGIALPKPGGLPGSPRKGEKEALPGDSLDMIRPASEYAGVAVRGPMANSRPEPPLEYDGWKGPARASTRVVRSKKEWDALWLETGGHDMPVVDFDRYTGLAVFAGTQPAGTKVVIVSAKPDGGRLEVRWRLDDPAAPEPGTTQPFKVILIKRTTATPVFREVK